MKKKIFLAFTLCLVIWGIWSQAYSFDVDKASAHLTENALPRSKSWCAWYTMRALQAGGCPAILLPAQWYDCFLPMVQFEEVSAVGYVPKKGDIVVFERPSWKKWSKLSGWWGHVAMYNGEQWISDFRQRDMNPYGKEVAHKIYRFTTSK